MQRQMTRGLLQRIVRMEVKSRGRREASIVVKASVLVSLIAASVAASAASADTMSRGERLFRAHCIGCHSFGCNRSGPKLQDVFGRSAGSVPDFAAYSESLRRSGIVWSEETLNEFLADPGKRVPGTWMSIVSLKNADDRREIITFLKRQDRSLDLCS
jgi:cytochrome c